MCSVWSKVELVKGGSDMKWEVFCCGFVWVLASRDKRKQKA